MWYQSATRLNSEYRKNKLIGTGVTVIGVGLTGATVASDNYVAAALLAAATFSMFLRSWLRHHELNREVLSIAAGMTSKHKPQRAGRERNRFLESVGKSEYSKKNQVRQRSAKLG